MAAMVERHRKSVGILLLPSPTHPRFISRLEMSIAPAALIEENLSVTSPIGWTISAACRADSSFSFLFLFLFSSAL